MEIENTKVNQAKGVGEAGWGWAEGQSLVNMVFDTKARSEVKVGQQGRTDRNVKPWVGWTAMRLAEERGRSGKLVFSYRIICPDYQMSSIYIENVLEKGPRFPDFFCVEIC